MSQSFRVSPSRCASSVAWPVDHSAFLYPRVPGGDEALAIGRSDGMLTLHGAGADALEEPRTLGIAPASIAFSALGTLAFSATIMT